MGKRRDEPDEPTLELPSFFRRKKRRTDDPAEESAAEDAAAAGPAEDEPVAEDPVEAEDPVAGAEPTPEPEPEPEPEPTVAAEPEPESAAVGESERALQPETAVAPEPEPAPEPVDTRDPDQHDTSVLEPRPAEPVQEPEPVPAPEAEAEPESASGGRRAARAARTPRTRPVLSPGAAALVAGAVVGAGGTALTWGALQGCEALRGTDSCGGPGLLVLVAILALMVVGGALLLKTLQVAEAKGTSFLGVGLMTVIVLVALMESLFSAWMFLAIPVLTALSYLAAQWVSTRFVDVEESSPGVDVR